MASSVYKKGLQGILEGNINLETDTIKAALIDLADYAPNFSTHDFLDDVAGAAIVGTAQTLGSKTFTDGVFDAADLSFTSVSGDPVEAVLIYQDTGSAATSRLICLNELTGAVTPNGGDINYAHDNGSNKIFRIVAVED